MRLQGELTANIMFQLLFLHILYIFYFLKTTYVINSKTNLKVDSGRIGHCVTYGVPSMYGVPRWCWPCQWTVVPSVIKSFSTSTIILSCWHTCNNYIIIEKIEAVVAQGYKWVTVTRWQCNIYCFHFLVMVQRGETRRWVPLLNT